MPPARTSVRPSLAAALVPRDNFRLSQQLPSPATAQPRQTDGQKDRQTDRTRRTGDMAGRRQSYYDSFPRTVFRDLDTDAYADCERALKLASTRNFIVDFGGASEAGGQAWCALDVTARDLDVRAFLSKRRDLRLRTRWMSVAPLPVASGSPIAPSNPRLGLADRGG